MAKRLGPWVLIFALVCAANVVAQLPAPSASPQAPAQPEIPQDRLGRSTPRGTVRGLLTAAAKGDYETAAQYLNTRQSGESAVNLAQKLVAVLNKRLPARLNEISDTPEGSVKFPNDPDKELVGIISGQDADVNVMVERIQPKGSPPIWLFSQKTLREIPDLYAELGSESARTGVSKFLFETKIARIALIHWFVLLIALPLLHFLGARVSRLVSRVLAALLYRLDHKHHVVSLEFLSGPIRLLLMA